MDVGDGRLKTEVYSTTPLSARPVLVIVLHGDLFNPTPSYQYAFAQALTHGFDAPVMPDPVRARLGVHTQMDDVVAVGLLRPTTLATVPMEIEVTRAATTTPPK